MQGGQLQLLEGWRPLTEVTDDKPWTLDSVAGLRDAILGATDGSVPPFFFGPPPRTGPVGLYAVPMRRPWG